jgi:hypothetical protein
MSVNVSVALQVETPERTEWLRYDRLIDQGQRTPAAQGDNEYAAVVMDIKRYP